MRGNSMCENREIPVTSIRDRGMDRPEKVIKDKAGMNASGKSDGCVVPAKSLSKDNDILSADAVEERQSSKGNTLHSATPRIQGRERVREGVLRDKRAKFTCSVHHITVATMNG